MFEGVKWGKYPLRHTITFCIGLRYLRREVSPEKSVSCKRLWCGRDPKEEPHFVSTDGQTDRKNSGVRLHRKIWSVEELEALPTISELKDLLEERHIEESNGWRSPLEGRYGTVGMKTNRQIWLLLIQLFGKRAGAREGGGEGEKICFRERLAFRGEEFTPNV